MSTGSLRYDKRIINEQEMKSIMSVRQSDQSVMTDIFLMNLMWTVEVIVQFRK